MAEVKKAADLDSSQDSESYLEVGVDVGGLEDQETAAMTALGGRNPPPSDTVSQQSTEETDGGKAAKKKKKSANRVIQDGEY